MRNFELNFRRDTLLKMRERWLKCILLPLAMKIVYSRAQFRFWINEIFNSEVGVNKNKMRPKSVKTFYSYIGSGIWMCLYGKQINPFETIALVPTEWICLLGDNPFRPNRYVCSGNGCVWSKWLRLFQLNICFFIMVAHILIIWMCLLRKASSEFLYKWQNSTPKWITQKNAE